jgi:hypothetical protein
MKLVSITLVAITVLLSLTVCNAQIKNSVTEKVKVSGNCGMCKTKIEKAGSLKNTAKVDWDADTQMATLTYDAAKTNQDEILKRIALSGYDSEKFLAPDNTYSKLPGCCQYDRVAKVAVKTEVVAEEHGNHENLSETEVQKTNQLKAVFDNYFAVKDALVKTDGNTASIKATELLSAINAVKMETLTTDEHTVWMKVLKNIKEDAEHIADTKDVQHQRDHFNTLSKNIYDLIKVSKQESPIYLQHCPMANDGKGADWLSKENTVKNPYYGSMMLSCGKVVETIK